MVLSIEVTEEADFVVSLSAADNVTIGVNDDGYVLIDDVYQEMLAEEVATLEVNASGLFKNTINLSGVDSRFSQLSGDDWIYSGKDNDSPLDDIGNDDIQGGLGNDAWAGQEGLDLRDGQTDTDIVVLGDGDGTDQRKSIIGSSSEIEEHFGVDDRQTRDITLARENGPNSLNQIPLASLVIFWLTSRILRSWRLCTSI